MILTEEEAKTKRCQESFGDTVVSPMGSAFPQVYHDPHGMMPSYTSGGYGTVVQSSPSMCLGSACMAWRWAEWETDPETRQRTQGTKGYCGKAGRP